MDKISYTTSVIWLVRRSIFEIVEEVLGALKEASDEAITIPMIAEMTGIKYESVRRALELIEMITNAGILMRIQDRPRKYIWVRRETDLEALAGAFFGVLLQDGKITVEDMERRFGLDGDSVRMVFQYLVDEGMARWVDEHTLGLLPISEYIDLTTEDGRRIRRILFGKRKKEKGTTR